jgi:hypothetical protein
MYTFLCKYRMYVHIILYVYELKIPGWNTAWFMTSFGATHLMLLSILKKKLLPSQ